ncbi:hypothetical protein M1M07_21595 [Rhodococcus sp. HM1]|uniref:hypothetical protein n=1 Tax=Rhodococcus sp. HM1 TaxID=2937759 RepID=UPI002009DCD3|nr:hypothetical protein [Rhodococcus sp. HM1]MCK8673690.1 hypothetical protein [Rhodococcus sp. HM1]
MDSRDERVRNRKAARRADRALCPVPVAEALGLRVAKVAAAMRWHGIEGPLDVATARRWLRGLEPIPDWCAELLAEAAARSAQRAARKRNEQIEFEHTLLLRTARVYRLLENGKRRRFRDADMDIVTDVALAAWRELMRGVDPSALSNGELRALRLCAIDPEHPEG